MPKGNKPDYDVKTSGPINGKTHYRTIGCAWKTPKGAISVRFNEEPAGRDMVLLPTKK